MNMEWLKDHVLIILIIKFLSQNQFPPIQIQPNFSEAI